MIGDLTKEEKTAEAGEDSGIGSIASCAWNAIHRLLAFYEHDLYLSRLTLRLTSLKDRIDEVEKENPSTKDSAIMKFCRSIAENKGLQNELNNPAENFADKEFNSQLEKIMTGFKLKNLEDKVGFLTLLKEERDFTAIQNAYRDGWSFYDLINDKDFKQTYIDKAVTESAGKSFKEDIDKCIELAEQGKKAASKYFEGKGVELRAYYTETDNAHRVLNINLINYNRSEPTKISDILQQEKELNIYCNKKREICAHREGKERHYKFEEGACYEMTSTWPVKDEFGNVSICTMIMNVSSGGITEVLKFNGKDFVLSEEIRELIKQNDELYIQGLSLHNAVIKSLKKGEAADVVPTANNNFQNESIVAYQDKEPEEKLDPKVDADNSLPPPPSINSNALIQTEVNLQHTETQPEVASQQMDELILNNQMLSEENVELKQEEAELQVINKKHHELTQENQQLQEKLETTQAEDNQTIVKERQNSDLQDKLGEERPEFDIPENEYEEFPGDTMLILKLTEDEDNVNVTPEKKKSRRFSSVDSGLGDEHYVSDQRPVEIEQEQKNTELQTELAQKDKKLASALAELQGKAQELESVCEEKGKLRQELEVANAKKEELKSKLKKSQEELYHVQEGKSDLEDKFDQLERSNKDIEEDKERFSKQVLDLQKELSCLKEVNQALSNELESAQTEKKRVNQKLAEAEQRIEALKKQTSDLKDKLEKKERGSKAEIDTMRKELTQLKENLEERAQKLKSVYEEKGKLEDKLKDVNTEKKELEDKLKEFEKEIDQAAHIMKEKEQSISNLKYQMLGLENEYKAQLESHEQEIDKLKWEIEERENKFKEYVASILESMDREHEDEIKELEENRDALSDIIAGKVLDIEGLTKELQDSKKEIEDLRNQVEMLSAETFADKQKGLNDQFYTLTGDISSEPDNAPRKKIELSRSLSLDNESYVPLEGERRSLRSLSIDGGYGGDEENCDNDLSSNITTSSIEKVAESRNVGSSPFLG
ncbi:hypothetical protein [Wolbachia endosymbiont (group A) of Barypeithes pellucidus]|uniref:hypothetical protein n=1 Tax=Wolbachia endosymbiont (group A) of Barypeithes pellucidus TaxID=3139322 RepID=UPI003CCAF669